MLIEKDIKKTFYFIKDNSFKDVNSDLVLQEMVCMGYSSPFNKNVYLDPKRIMGENYNQKLLEGLIAHELGHQVSYKSRTFVAKWLFLSNYFISPEKYKLVEQEANKVAIQRGYSEQTLALAENDESYVKKTWNPNLQEIKDLVNELTI